MPDNSFVYYPTNNPPAAAPTPANYFYSPQHFAQVGTPAASAADSIPTFNSAAPAAFTPASSIMAGSWQPSADRSVMSLPLSPLDVTYTGLTGLSGLNPVNLTSDGKLLAVDRSGPIQFDAEASTLRVPANVFYSPEFQSRLNQTIRQSPQGPVTPGAEAVAPAAPPAAPAGMTSQQALFAGLTSKIRPGAAAPATAPAVAPAVSPAVSPAAAPAAAAVAGTPPAYPAAEVPARPGPAATPGMDLDPASTTPAAAAAVADTPAARKTIEVSSAAVGVPKGSVIAWRETPGVIDGSSDTILGTAKSADLLPAGVKPSTFGSRYLLDGDRLGAEMDPSEKPAPGSKYVLVRGEQAWVRQAGAAPDAKAAAGSVDMTKRFSASTQRDPSLVSRLGSPHPRAIIGAQPTAENTVAIPVNAPDGKYRAFVRPDGGYDIVASTDPNDPQARWVRSGMFDTGAAWVEPKDEQSFWKSEAAGFVYQGLVGVFGIAATYIMSEKNRQQSLKLAREDRDTQLEALAMQFAARGGGGGGGGGDGGGSTVVGGNILRRK